MNERLNSPEHPNMAALALLPSVNKSGEIVGIECLARPRVNSITLDGANLELYMNDVEKNPREATHFTTHMVKKAIRLLTQFPDLQVSVNVPLTALHTDDVISILNSTAEKDKRARRLTVEITERQPLPTDDPELTSDIVECLGQIQKIAKVEIDDFIPPSDETPNPLFPPNHSYIILEGLLSCGFRPDGVKIDASQSGYKYRNGLHTFGTITPPCLAILHVADLHQQHFAPLPKITVEGVRESCESYGFKQLANIPNVTSLQGHGICPPVKPNELRSHSPTLFATSAS